MRIILFFDLPTLTLTDMAEYRKFRNYLIKSGFIMLQESVYCKFALNNIVCDSVKRDLKNNLPSGGLVQTLTITEKQFSNMEYLKGKSQNKIIDSDCRFIEL